MVSTREAVLGAGMTTGTLKWACLGMRGTQLRPSAGLASEDQPASGGRGPSVLSPSLIHSSLALMGVEGGDHGQLRAAEDASGRSALRFDAAARRWGLSALSGSPVPGGRQSPGLAAAPGPGPVRMALQNEETEHGGLFVGG